MHHFGSFTLPGRFLQPFEVFAAIKNERHPVFKKPQNSKVYTKVTAKANRPTFRVPDSVPEKPWFFNLVRRGRFHLAQIGVIWADAGAFSSEVDTGSREENASKQRL